MSRKSKPPIWFWVVSVLALLWNLMGVYAYLDQAFASNDVLGEIASAAKNLINPTPAWVTAAFATAVFAGAIGSLLLLLRKGLAEIMFLVSMVAVFIQNGYYAFLTDQDMDAGPGGLPMVIMVIGFAIGLFFFAKKAKSSGWIS
ncbi:MAG: hypothetical protein AB8B73_00760 [Ekhidna sp.]